jgi:hypothetical protein
MLCAAARTPQHASVSCSRIRTDLVLAAARRLEQGVNLAVSAHTLSAPRCKYARGATRTHHRCLLTRSKCSDSPTRRCHTQKVEALSACQLADE